MHLITQLTKPGVDEVTQHFAVHTIENVVLKVCQPSSLPFVYLMLCDLLGCAFALVVKQAAQPPALLLHSSIDCDLQSFADCI